MNIDMHQACDKLTNIQITDNQPPVLYLAIRLWPKDLKNNACDLWPYSNLSLLQGFEPLTTPVLTRMLTIELCSVVWKTDSMLKDDAIGQEM